DDCFVRVTHRKRCAALDSCRAIAENPIEFGAQVCNDAPDTFVRKGILVPGVGCRKQPQILEALVANQSLREFCNSLHNIDEVKHDASFRSQNEIEVAQTDIEVDNHDLFAHLR